MFGLQTLSCINDIPLVRSSTDKVQDVYAKAKDASILIRLPCNLAETVVDTSVKVALTVMNPLVKPLTTPVRAIDDYAAQKIRQFENKYPVINTQVEDVVNTFNEKTEPVRNVMNSVKDTTATTLQQGKETVSHVATATLDKASNAVDSLFSFCESRVPGAQRQTTGKPRRSTGYGFATVGSLFTNAYESVQSSFTWARVLVVFILLRIKQINETLLTKFPQIPYVFVLPQRVLIVFGTFLDFCAVRVSPDDRTLSELKKTKQQARYTQPTQYFPNRPNARPNPPVTTRQSVVVTKQETVVTRNSNSNNYPQQQQQQTRRQPDYSNLTDTQELHARLANNDYQDSMYNVDNDDFVTETGDNLPNDDIAELHQRVNATDIELLYSRLPTDVVAVVDTDEPLNPDQQELHARIIADGLQRQGYPVDDN